MYWIEDREEQLASYRQLYSSTFTHGIVAIVDISVLGCVEVHVFGGSLAAAVAVVVAAAAVSVD